LLEGGVCKTLRGWIGCRRGNPMEAGSIEQVRVLQKGVNKCNVNRLAAIFAGSRRFHKNT
jgi:hypothetical protein